MKKKIVLGIIMGILASGTAFGVANSNGELEVPVINTITVNDEAAKLNATIDENHANMAPEQKLADFEVDFNKEAGFSVHIDSLNNFVMKNTGSSTDDDIAYKLKCVEVSAASGGNASTNTFTMINELTADGNCVDTNQFKVAAADLKYDLKLTLSNPAALRSAFAAAGADQYKDDITITLVDKTAP